MYISNPITAYSTPNHNLPNAHTLGKPNLFAHNIITNFQPIQKPHRITILHPNTVTNLVSK